MSFTEKVSFESISQLSTFRIITGIGIAKIEQVITLVIAERELLPNGQVNRTEENPWRISQGFLISETEDTIDYHRLSWENRSIDLDTVLDLETPMETLVTGVRFRVVDGHIRLEARFTKFDHNSGQLKDLQRSVWIGNHVTNKRRLPIGPTDIPTRSPSKSKPLPFNNEFIEFEPSDIRLDAAQSTLPFIDNTAIDAQTPLTGVGLHYRGTDNHGGFLAPKLVLHDFGSYITPPGTLDNQI